MFWCRIFSMRITYVIISGLWSLPVALVSNSLFNSQRLLCRFLCRQGQASHHNLQVLVLLSVKNRRHTLSNSTNKRLPSQTSSASSWAHTQCPAVSTQQLSMRTPPQMCENAWLLFFGLSCKDTCQGIAPGLTFRPLIIRVMAFFGWAIPHVENSCGAGVVLSGVVGAAVDCEAWVGSSGTVGSVVDGWGAAVGSTGLGWSPGASVVGSVGSVGSTSVGDSSNGKRSAELVLLATLAYSPEFFQSTEADLSAQGTLTHHSSPTTTSGPSWRSTMASCLHLGFCVIQNIEVSTTAFSSRMHVCDKSPQQTCKSCEGQVRPLRRRCWGDRPRYPEWSASSSRGTRDPSPSRSHCRGMTPHHPRSSLLGLQIAQRGSVGVIMINMLAGDEGNNARYSIYQFGRNFLCSLENTGIQSYSRPWRMCRRFCMDWGYTRQLWRRIQWGLKAHFKSSVPWDLLLINIDPAHRMDVMVLVDVVGICKQCCCFSQLNGSFKIIFTINWRKVKLAFGQVKLVNWVLGRQPNLYYFWNQASRMCWVIGMGATHPPPIPTQWRIKKKNDFEGWM